MSPQRIQRKRTKGWRMPEGAVYVGRGSKWGNPYKVGAGLWTERGWTDSATPEDVVASFAEDYTIGACDVPDIAEVRAELVGKDLACWCKPEDSCHADVLLELANR